MHPLKVSIERKLYLSRILIPLADELEDKHRATLISRMNRAFSDGRQVQILDYHSSNSSQIVADRTVEPISLTDDFTTLNAFELVSQKQKTFKIAGIEDAELLGAGCITQHDSEELDFFGFSGPMPLPLVLRLSLLAHPLLHEEFPASH